MPQNRPDALARCSRSVPRENPVLPLVDRRGTYWKYLEDRYDSILLDTLVCKGENRKASELVAKMLGQAATREEQAKVYVRRGVAYHKIGDVNKALADFKEAIRLDPKDVVAFLGRGYALAAGASTPWPSPTSRRPSGWTQRRRMPFRGRGA